MFRRFTRSARMAVARAQEEAVLLGHGEVATEHLLLGLFVDPGSPVVSALESFDVTSEEVRAQMHRVRSSPGDAPAAELPFTPRASCASSTSRTTTCARRWRRSSAAGRRDRRS